MEKEREENKIYIMDEPDYSFVCDMNDFMFYCLVNPVCCQLIQKALPELCMDGTTAKQNINTIVLFGLLADQDYENAKAAKQEMGMKKRNVCFFNLVDQVREILKPIYQHGEVVERYLNFRVDEL